MYESKGTIIWCHNKCHGVRDKAIQTPDRVEKGDITQYLDVTCMMIATSRILNILNFVDGPVEYTLYIYAGPK